MVTRFPVLRRHVDIPPRPASHPPSASSRCHHLTSLFFPPSLVPTMWRSSSLSPSRFRLLRSTLAAFTDRSVKLTTNTTTATASAFSPRHRLLSSILPDGVEGKDPVTLAEAKRMMRLMNVESLKRKLEMGGEEVIGYQDLLKACEGMGLARNADEARIFAKVLDEAGVVLLFRDKVYLHPDKVVDLIKKAVPLALSPEDDPRREEYKELQKKKEDIDMLAHRQVRRILWSGLGFFICQVGLFFRLTFWEFSWDVMEPITFFTTTTGLVVGYGYFLFTSRDPTYQDLMMRLFLSRQRKLFQKQKFDIDRFLELQKQCKCPLDRT